MAVKGEIVIDRERCKGCAVCVGACPNAVIALSKNVKYFRSPCFDKTGQCKKQTRLLFCHNIKYRKMR